MRRPPAATEQNEAGMAPEKCQSQHPDWMDPPPEQRCEASGHLALRAPGKRRATNKLRSLSPLPGCGRTRVGFAGLGVCCCLRLLPDGNGDGTCEPPAMPRQGRQIPPRVPSLGSVELWPAPVKAAKLLPDL